MYLSEHQRAGWSSLVLLPGAQIYCSVLRWSERSREWERRSESKKSERLKEKDSCARHSHVCLFRGGRLTFYVRLWWDLVGILMTCHCQIEAKTREKMLKGLKDNVSWKSWQLLTHSALKKHDMMLFSVTWDLSHPGMSISGLDLNWPIKNGC